MKKFTSHILILVAAAGLVAGGCDRRSKSGSSTSTHQTGPRVWTPEEIAKDPQKYLRWSDEQVVLHIKQSEKRLADLQKSRDQFAQKRELLDQNIDDVRNINRRLKEAVQRAEDEDRWPIKIGDRVFTAEKAAEVIKQTQQYIDERNPMAERYDQFLDKVDSSIAATKKDISNLNQLREKLALDLESVKLNEGAAEVDKLRGVESQLSQMSSAVADMSDDPLKIDPPKEPPGRVNIDEMLK